MYKKKAIEGTCKSKIVESHTTTVVTDPIVWLLQHDSNWCQNTGERF